MLYFYLWCLFLVCIVLSVPLVSYFDKRKLPPLRPMVADDPLEDDQPMGDEGLGDDMGEADVELEPAGDDAFGGGGDDFPEFDEEVT